MKGIDLPIMVHSDETYMLEDLGIDVKDEECKEKTFTFYTIDVIASRMNNEDHTMIQSGGKDFICVLPVDEVKRIIENG